MRTDWQHICRITAAHTTSCRQFNTAGQREAAHSSSTQRRQQGLIRPYLTVMQHWNNHILMISTRILKSKNDIFIQIITSPIYTVPVQHVKVCTTLLIGCLQIPILSSTFFFPEFLHQISLSPFCSQMVLLYISLLLFCSLCHPQQKSHK